jgi:aminoglycoside phosphotransferase (APT) family kinase protein
MVDDAFRRLVVRIDAGARLLREWPLVGGVSAQVTALAIERADGTIETLVARLHGPRDLGANANIARDEFRLLQIVESNGIAAPRPIFLDESCELFPTPIVVATFIDGVMIDDADEVDDVESIVRQMAEQLAAIHRVPDSAVLSFLPQVYERFPVRPAVLDETLSEGRIRDALDGSGTPEPLNVACLLHGDYWPGNLLWRDGRLAAVLDWEDAERGDPLNDLGNARMEVLFTFGPEAMQTFTERYLEQATVDTTHLPYWDLVAAVHPCGRMSEWGLDADDEARMKDRHGWFVEQAIARLWGATRYIGR